MSGEIPALETSGARSKAPCGHLFRRTGDGSPVALRSAIRSPIVATAYDAPGLRRSPAAVQPRAARPAKTSSPGSPRRKPVATAKPGRSSSATIRCRRFMAVSAITPARTRATARTSTKRSASMRSSGSSATWRSSKDGPSHPTNRHRTNGCSSSALDRAVSRPPGTWHARTRGCHPRGGTDGGRHDALRHPQVPPATEVLDGEIERIRRIGVEIVLNHKVTDLMSEKTEGRFDAVFLAVGAHLSKRQEIPARDAGKVYDALQFLKEVETGDKPPRLGRRVAVYGGGNTAMDAARTAARLGRGAAHHLPPHARADAGARLRGGRSD